MVSVPTMKRVFELFRLPAMLALRELPVTAAHVERIAWMATGPTFFPAQPKTSGNQMAQPKLAMNPRAGLNARPTKT